MVKLKLHIKAWCYIYLMSSVHSARILGIFPIEGSSHFNFHEAIMKCLLSVGHQVTLIAPFQPQNLHENLTVVDSKTIPHQLDLSSVSDLNLSWFATALIFLDLLEHYCSQIWAIYDSKDLKNFDIIFVETLPLYRCFLPIAEKVKIPVIGTISCRSMMDSDFSVGISRHPSVFPSDDELVPRQRYPKMTFYQRITNFMQETQIRVYSLLGEWMASRFNEKHFPESDWNQLKVSLLFANDHDIFLPRARPPNFVNIGGLSVKSSSLKPLPQNFKQFIEEAKHGVILFSLGTVVSDDLIDEDLQFILKNTFAKIPQRVIWKTNQQIEGLSENVLLTKWMPQKEILAHYNVLAFISHAGLGSSYESIYFAKPMILIPVFGDQPSNAAYLSSLEVGLYLEFLEITEANLLDAINKIINDTKYRRNMADLSSKFRNDLKSPADLVVYWTEYVLRHKGELHLRAIEADIPFYQYLLLDVIMFISFIAVISGFSFVICIRLIKKKF